MHPSGRNQCHKIMWSPSESKTIVIEKDFTWAEFFLINRPPSTAIHFYHVLLQNRQLKQPLPVQYKAKLLCYCFKYKYV